MAFEGYMLEATVLACFFDLLNKSAGIPNINTNLTMLCLILRGSLTILKYTPQTSLKV